MRPYPLGTNPGSLRARIDGTGDYFSELLAKTGQFRHMFLKFAISSIFKPKYAIFRQENVRYYTLLGGKTQPGSTLRFCTRFSARRMGIREAF